MTLTLIDTHAHLYSNKFDNDRQEVVQRAIAAGVVRIYLPNIDSASIHPMLELEAAFPQHCFGMMGLHPTHVLPETYLAELDTVERYLSERPWAGIGETGIDLYWDKSSLPLQQEAFSRHCIWARELRLPLIIHSRCANREAIALVRQHQDGRLRGIFHCFEGTLREALEMIDLGFMLGIGGVLTRPNSPIREVIRKVALQHIVLETDAPYLTPAPYKGRRNESAFITAVAEALAQIKEQPLEEVAQITTQNALKLFDN
ncbi:MAG: TatD family hydrolase [Saprospiraceae bacterium]|nr:TatD family hydrolase [Saprospiraceae bacterium]MDW8483426.1 TatD family hydrolase [Saprospiraceae bacterium]